MGRHDGPPKKVPAPGLQPVAPEEEERAPQLGRVVSRFERSAEELDALSSQWQQVAEKKLSGAQKLRVKEAITRLRARLEEMEGRLG